MGRWRHPTRVALATGAAALVALVAGRAAFAATSATDGGRPAAGAGRAAVLGAALNTTQLGSPVTHILGTGFGSITPEYEMEMDHVEPAPGRFTFGESDRLVSYAQRHGLAVRGHALVWDEQLPAWIRERSWTRPQLVSVHPTTARSGPTLAGRLRRQAGVYADVGWACRAVPACSRVAIWGHDRRRQLARGRPALPFGVDYRPKPAWTALEAAIGA